MLLAFIFLSYYQLVINGSNSNPDSYLKRIPSLAYGFIDGASFSINFTEVESSFVFGLATNQEIEAIKKVNMYQVYCTGISQISTFQYFINSTRLIEGEISTKGVLTPYIFSCEYQTKVKIAFKYSNGSNNLDYRCQVFQFFIIALMGVVTIYAVCFSIFSYCPLRNYSRDTFNILLILLLLSIIIQDAISYLYYALQDDQEYFQTPHDRQEYLFNSIYKVSSVGAIFFSFILIFAYCFIRYFYENQKKPSCCNFTIFIFSIICFSSILFSFTSRLFLNIIVAILVFIFINFVIFLPPVKKTIKFGLAFYLFGILFVSPGASIALYFLDDMISIQLASLIITSIFAVFQIISIFLLIPALRYKPANVDSQSFVNSDSSYQLSYMGSNSSVNTPYHNDDGNTGFIYNPESQLHSPLIQDNPNNQNTQNNQTTASNFYQQNMQNYPNVY